ncbi:MAG: ribosomal RNA adenine dimethylase [SAR86 cluster bacterium]|uniref:Ribosomal RNA adenine dimethylase n=1 Tax=SAR86 cluster bacterium TaxID=2030880 RepID=A0A2A4MLD1_9GAMM|nr:MAG: ribosomal RNA adenine dimethylase [SAR86 cluster bacterium]
MSTGFRARVKAGLRVDDSIKLIKTIKTSGTITPSSKQLIENLLRSIDFEKVKCIIELGPGNGCITKALLRRMPQDSVLISFELNADFVPALEALNDPRLHVVNSCASSIRAVLDEMGIAKVDQVVSSLPLALIHTRLRREILATVDSNLEASGRFLQYQYSLKNYADLKQIFPEVKLRFTLRNMPPAFVYDCSKRA